MRLPEGTGHTIARHYDRLYACALGSWYAIFTGAPAGLKSRSLHSPILRWRFSLKNG